MLDEGSHYCTIITFYTNISLPPDHVYNSYEFANFAVMFSTHRSPPWMIEGQFPHNSEVTLAFVD